MVYSMTNPVDNRYRYGQTVWLPTRRAAADYSHMVAPWAHAVQPTLESPPVDHLFAMRISLRMCTTGVARIPVQKFLSTHHQRPSCLRATKATFGTRRFEARDFIRTFSKI
jgi:hypothetical protein